MSKKSPHILYSAAWYPNATGKQSSPFIKNHAEAISQYCRLSVIAVFSSDKHRTIKLEHTKVNDNLNEYLVYVPQLPVEKSPIFRVLAGFLYILGYLWGLFNILKDKKEGFALMHINVLTRAGIIPYFINKVFKTPYLITEHWSRYYPGNEFQSSGWHYKMTQLIISNASQVQCASHKLAKAMQNLGLKNSDYSLFKNTIDLNTFSYLPKEHRELKRFITVAFFRDKAKNLSGILNTLARLRDNGFNFTYTFVGNGDDFELIKQRAKDLQLESNVRFVGFLNKDDIAKELNASDCSILFSNYESQPVSIIESLACGTPVIATNVGDIAHMLPTECGTLISEKDEDALFDEMVKVIYEEKNYSSEICVQEAKTYSYENVGCDFYQIYLKTIEQTSI